MGVEDLCTSRGSVDTGSWVLDWVLRLPWVRMGFHCVLGRTHALGKVYRVGVQATLRGARRRCLGFIGVRLIKVLAFVSSVLLVLGRIRGS